MASQAEETPSCTTTEDKEATQNQDNLTEDISTEIQQTDSQPSPARTNPGRGRPPKTTPPSSQKKIVAKEGGSAAQDAPGFQDDPSDADYMPSKQSTAAHLAWVLASISQVWWAHIIPYSVHNNTTTTNKQGNIFSLFTESQLKPAGSSSYMSSRGRRIRKRPRRNFPPGEQAAQVFSAVSSLTTTLYPKLYTGYEMCWVSSYRNIQDYIRV